MKKRMNLKLYKNNNLEKEYNDINCIDKDNCLIFTTENVTTKLSDKIFSRESTEFKFEIDLKNRQAFYTLKENNVTFEIEVIKLDFKRNNNVINFEYLIGTDDKPFILKAILEKGENSNE